MDHRAARREFKRGLMLLRERRPQAALRHMRQAVALDENKPHYFSYFGVAIALAEKKWATAELYCRTALRMKHDDARLHLNLAQVYVSAARGHDALRALKTGLQCARRRCSLLTRALRKLLVRRPPLLSFLDRRHFLNRYLGTARHRVLDFLAYGRALASSESQFLL
jgi:Flp pilus assembly protein TadD